uniref:Uncharacterized protein n=1 Tax=Arundo donax TaxID=35708 RepID=A0A0A9AN13_ARUDO
MWISNNNHVELNMLSAANCWSLWQGHSGLCFQGQSWTGMEAKSAGNDEEVANCARI